MRSLALTLWTAAAIVAPFLGACLGQIAALGFDVWAPRMAAELAAFLPF